MKLKVVFRNSANAPKKHQAECIFPVLPTILHPAMRESYAVDSGCVLAFILVPVFLYTH